MAYICIAGKLVVIIRGTSRHQIAKRFYDRYPKYRNRKVGVVELEEGKDKVVTLFEFVPEEVRQV